MERLEGPNLASDLEKVETLRQKLEEAKAERERLLADSADNSLRQEQVDYLDVTIRRIPLVINHIKERMRASLVGKVTYFSDIKPRPRPRRTL